MNTEIKALKEQGYTDEEIAKILADSDEAEDEVLEEVKGADNTVC